MPQEFDRKLFGERLRFWRETVVKKTAEDLAELSGVPMHTIVRMERGETDKPGFVEVVSLGDTYGLDPNRMAVMAGIRVELPEEESLDHDAELARKLLDYLQELRKIDDKEHRRVYDFFDLAMRIHQEKRPKPRRRTSAGVSILPESLRRIAGIEA